MSMQGVQMPTTIKNRKGRKRKSTRREPSGKPQRTSIDYRAMAARNPDRRGLPEALRTHERAECVLGRMNLRKLITDDEYEAGRRYMVLTRSYRAMIGAPRLAAMRALAKEPLAPIDTAPDASRLRSYWVNDDELTRRYDDAYCSIRTHAAHLAVNAVAVHDQAIPPYQLIHLRDGLAALARHFGLTNQRKR